ncbi:MAG: tetratricopeptide repeat protein [Candidatus Hydrogenedentes bacterium]|nr:tetratricopeptide repeat protein [Candidatus Hydrogenedentota bacterium]
MNTRQRVWLAGAAVAVLAAAAYVNTLDGGWVWDDVSSVLLHRHVQDPSKIGQLFLEDQHAFGMGQGNFYRPLLSVSFMADYLLSGGPSPEATAASGKGYPDVPPLVFHLDSIGWHALAAVLLLLLLLRLGTPVAAAAGAAAVFAVHPLHTEAVAYISGRADMMSAALMFAALLLCLSGRGGARRALAGAAGMACLAGALLSKESSLVFPVLLAVVLGVDWAAKRASAEEAAPRAAGHFAPLAAAVLVVGTYIALRATVLNFAPADAAATEAAPLGNRLVDVFQAFALYLRLLFLPTGLHMEWTLDGYPGWLALPGAAAFLALVAAGVLAVRSGRFRIAGGILWFIAAWLPISGVFPINAPLAEHWMYVPMAGFWWAFMEGIHRERGAFRRVMPAAALALVLLFLPLTAARNADWHDNERLFRATLAENPGSARVHYNLAVTYEDVLKNPAGARRHYEAALRTGRAPDVADIHLSLGRVLERMNDPAAAAAEYERVLGRREGAAELMVHAALGLGRCRLALGDWGGAMNVLQQLASREPGLLPEVERLFGAAPFSEEY